MTNRVCAIVGMAGAGKSEAVKVFERHGFARVRFGDITDNEIKARGLTLTEKDERQVREQLRKEHGMAAYAKLSLPRIDSLLKSGDVVVDGLYSWEEYILMKGRYGDSLAVVAVCASPKTRYDRLAKRQVRPLTPQEAASRDTAEICASNKGGPIAMAEFTIVNESTLDELMNNTERVIAALR